VFSFKILPVTAKNEHIYVKIRKNFADNIITASLDLTFHAEMMSKIYGNVKFSQKISVCAGKKLEKWKNFWLHAKNVSMAAGFKEKQHKFLFVLFPHKQPVWFYVALPTALVFACEFMFAVVCRKLFASSSSISATFLNSAMSSPRFLQRNRLFENCGEYTISYFIVPESDSSCL